MLIHFTKMHGLGNDFVVIDLVTQKFKLQPRHVRFLADRNLGVGCDQVLVVEPPEQPDVEFKYRIFNADGSEVEQCGNGARCFAKFVREKKLTGSNSIRVETNSGIINLNMKSNTKVEVDMGAPLLKPEEIPLQAEKMLLTYTFPLSNGRSIELGAVSMGNPHGVLLVDDVDQADVEGLGVELESHSLFPQKANIGFLQILDTHTAKLRVFERGVGETKACGTGACAAVVQGIRAGLLQSPVEIHLPGGYLNISWAGEQQPVFMTGPATTVFEGKVHLKT